MLQRRYRLRRTSDIQQVYRTGERLRTPLAMIISRPNGLDVSRFAIIAGRRIGHAVVRNRARRRVHEIIRLHLAELSSGRDWLIILHPAVVTAKVAEIERAILPLLTQGAKQGGRDPSGEKYIT